METVSLPRHLYDQILQIARASPDVEACGLIAAKIGRPGRCIAIPNVAEQPDRLFSMDPARQIDAFREMRERGEELFAIFHSHTDSPARPSTTDLQQANYPEALYLIVALHGAGAPDVRAYRIRNGKADAVTLEIPEADDPG
jgi:proteasome lid subunit RPN8/RPN11